MNLNNFERAIFKFYIFTIIISSLMFWGNPDSTQNTVSIPTKESNTLDNKYYKQPNDSLYDNTVQYQEEEIFKTDSDYSETDLYTDSSNSESNLFGENDSIKHIERRKAIEDALF